MEAIVAPPWHFWHTRLLASGAAPRSASGGVGCSASSPEFALEAGVGPKVFLGSGEDPGLRPGLGPCGCNASRASPCAHRRGSVRVLPGVVAVTPRALSDDSQALRIFSVCRSLPGVCCKLRWNHFLSAYHSLPCPGSATHEPHRRLSMRQRLAPARETEGHRVLRFPDPCRPHGVRSSAGCRPCRLHRARSSPISNPRGWGHCEERLIGGFRWGATPNGVACRRRWIGLQSCLVRLCGSRAGAVLSARICDAWPWLYSSPKQAGRRLPGTTLRGRPSMGHLLPATTCFPSVYVPS